MITTLDTQTWAETGTRLLSSSLDRLGDRDLDAPCALPGWTRRHLLAHVASNAEAIGRLLEWARTGVETPMYSSPEQRAADIETGSARPDLREWVRASATTLTAAMDALPAEAWSARVVTAQGRIVPASETPWMRARETCIHAVDLDAGTTFAELPDAFLRHLLDEVAAWRSSRGGGPAVVLVTPETRHDIAGDGAPQHVELPLAAAAAWIVGRGPGPDQLALPRWL
ncbi:maleylpyruvate isomerase family mycothiol-dependent enzyme [Streptomyces sp. NBC_01361]|uniref:maleylpyruvate isomerase family mycothiol-dependent enzyme n=1 Tax=Streptomyces sp. NBC_01361 TaxID=2903838 RepID=UPI002E305338|nr:maleylpyruvate isomerase family mycothiol-dependent enzyme [Streptomyces sp. NBC_01361]